MNSVLFHSSHTTRELNLISTCGTDSLIRICSGSKSAKFREIIKRAVNRVWPTLLRYMDTNNTGKISRTEYKESMERRGKSYHLNRWHKLDLNHNGRLTKTEFYHAVLFSKCSNGGVQAISSKKMLKTCTDLFE